MSILPTLGAAAMRRLSALFPAAGRGQMWLLYAADRPHGARLYGSGEPHKVPPLEKPATRGDEFERYRSLRSAGRFEGYVLR